jgi:hypothetical protein
VVDATRFDVVLGGEDRADDEHGRGSGRRRAVPMTRSCGGGRRSTSVAQEEKRQKPGKGSGGRRAHHGDRAARRTHDQGSCASLAT